MTSASTPAASIPLETASMTPSSTRITPATSETAVKRRLMVDLYKRVVDGVAELGFPLSIHLEATYGNSGPAFQTFAEMLSYWSPAGQI